MNYKHQEIGAPASLILTVPAYSFVVALNLHCLGRSNRAAFSAGTVANADGETFETKDPALGGRITRVSSAGKRDVKQLSAVEEFTELEAVRSEASIEYYPLLLAAKAAANRVQNP